MNEKSDLLPPGYSPDPLMFEKHLGRPLHLDVQGCERLRYGARPIGYLFLHLVVHGVGVGVGAGELQAHSWTVFLARLPTPHARFSNPLDLPHPIQYRLGCHRECGNREAPERRCCHLASRETERRVSLQRHPRQDKSGYHSQLELFPWRCRLCNPARNPLSV